MVYLKGPRSPYVFCLVVFAAIDIVLADMGQVREYMMTVIQSCNTNGASLNELVAVMADSGTTSHQAKCILSCVMKQTNLLNGDGSFNIDAVVKLREKAQEDMSPEKLRGISTAIAQKCSGITGEDECELAFNVYRCGKREYKAMGP